MITYVLCGVGWDGMCACDACVCQCVQKPSVCDEKPFPIGSVVINSINESREKCDEDEEVTLN